MAVPADSLPDRASIQAIAREVAQLLRLGEQSGADRLLTARQVAVRFNVERSWVYAHADELGVVRLGFGQRPRLRFDAAVVAQRLVASGARAAAVPPQSQVKAGAPLLPIRPSRPRRNLELE